MQKYECLDYFKNTRKLNLTSATEKSQEELQLS